MPRFRNRRRGFNTSMDYIQQESEQNAIKKMELAFSREKYEDTKLRQEATDKRAQQRFDWASIEQGVKNISASANPIMQTLKDPLDISQDEMSEIGKSIKAFEDEGRYDESEMEKSSRLSNTTILNKLYDNAVQYQNATAVFNKVRDDYNNLQGDYEDSQGNEKVGILNTKDSAALIKNAEQGIASIAATENDSLIKAYDTLLDEARTSNFVATQLEKLRGKRTQGTLSSGESIMLELAEDQVKSELYGDAYNTLVGVAKEGVTVSRFKANAQTFDEMNAEADRKFINSNAQFIKNASAKMLGDYDYALKTFSDSIAATKTNLMSSPETFAMAQQGFMNLIRRTQSEEDEYFQKSEVFEEIPQYSNTDTNLTEDKLEGMALVMMGVITKEDGSDNLIYPDGDVYLSADGTIAKGNRPGEKLINSDYMIRYSQEIKKNLKKLVYGGDGDKEVLRQANASAARMYLRLNKTANPNRKLIELENSSDKIDEETIRSNISNNNLENTDSDSPTIKNENTQIASKSTTPTKTKTIDIDGEKIVVPVLQFAEGEKPEVKNILKVSFDWLMQQDEKGKLKGAKKKLMTAKEAYESLSPKDKKRQYWANKILEYEARYMALKTKDTKSLASK